MAAAGAARSARGSDPKRLAASDTPAGTPYVPTDAGPALNTWVTSPKVTGIGTSSSRRDGSAPRPGASTKKSSSVAAPPGWATSMYPPPPSPVRPGSATREASMAAIAASTALPPARRASAPASAVRGWPAAMTPRAGICALASGNELGHVELLDAEAAAPRRRAGGALDELPIVVLARPLALAARPVAVARPQDPRLTGRLLEPAPPRAVAVAGRGRVAGGGVGGGARPGGQGARGVPRPVLPGARPRGLAGRARGGRGS